MASRIDSSRLAYAQTIVSKMDDHCMFAAAKKVFSPENYVNWDGRGSYPFGLQDRRISWGIFPDDSLFLALRIVVSHNSPTGLSTVKLLVQSKHVEIEESPNIYMFDPKYRAADLSSLLNGQTLSFGRGWTVKLSQ